MSGLPEGYREAHPLPPLGGGERFHGLNATVADFWRWAFSDLRMNVVRGSLAEFLVASAVGATGQPKVEWANYDVLTPDGVRVEVKSSAYWQSWAQRGPSRIVFSGLSARAFRDNMSYSDDREVRADVFVFALQTCIERERYDPLEIDQWEFYVSPARVVRESGVRSVSLAFLERHGAQRVPWGGLRHAIDEARPPN